MSRNSDSVGASYRLVPISTTGIDQGTTPSRSVPSRRNDLVYPCRGLGERDRGPLAHRDHRLARPTGPLRSRRQTAIGGLNPAIYAELDRLQPGTQPSGLGLIEPGRPEPAAAPPAQSATGYSDRSSLSEPSPPLRRRSTYRYLPTSRRCYAPPNRVCHGTTSTMVSTRTIRAAMPGHS